MEQSKVKVDGLYQEVMKAIAECEEDAREALKDTLADEADQGSKEVKSSAANLFGDGPYAKSWTKKKISDMNWVIHNKKHYQLVHLLEKGHDIVRAGKVVGHARAFPHVAPVEEKIRDRIAENFKRRFEG